METILNKESRAAIELMVADGIIAKDTAERYFPELKESEDERIRKRIIALVNAHGQGMYKDEMLAWLEKQGEQKPADKIEPKFKVGDTVTVKPMSCHGKVFKGEPFKIVGIIKDNYVSDDGKTYSISLQDGWELVEQRPAWSEEDEIYIENIRLAVEKQYPIAAKDIVDWLKSLKDRVQPQPKQEWSEEDRRMLIGLIDELDAIMNKATPNEISVYSKYTNWLKSLRPQNRWKPSDEQMKALEDAIRYGEKELIGILSLLYNDLKKLKG